MVVPRSAFHCGAQHGVAADANEASSLVGVGTRVRTLDPAQCAKRRGVWGVGWQAGDKRVVHLLRELRLRWELLLFRETGKKGGCLVVRYKEARPQCKKLCRNKHNECAQPF